MKKAFIALVIMFGLSVGGLVSSPAFAASDCAKNPSAAGCPCAINPDASVCKELVKEKDSSTFSVTLKIIINTLLFAIGIVAVIMIIVSGIRFTASHGDPGSVTKARLTMIYAVVGLVVAILAFAIVNFVVDQL